MKARSEKPASHWLAIVMLAAFTLLTFANAAHETLVLDDKAFVGADRTVSIDSAAEAFLQDVWGRGTYYSGLYRPLLLITFELENHLFADWPRGFHLVNIGLHLLCVLLLYGFLYYLLRSREHSHGTAALSALLAALVFAVHPVHAEAVNSVFNRSSIYVSIAAILGLWWALSRVETRPWQAWVGLGLVYSVSILFKESALVIPGIAVALIVILFPGNLAERLRRIPGIFWLFAPIVLFFLLRAVALTPDGADAVTAESYRSGMVLANDQSLLVVLANLGRGLRVILWPDPLRLFYPAPTGQETAILIAAQVALIAAAVALYFRRRPGLAAGLSFYYIAMLPASRLISMDDVAPNLAERYLYFPSVGLALTLSFAIAAAVRRFGPRLLVIAGMPLILLLAALTWERNYEWSRELYLFQTDYDLGFRGPGVIRLYAGKLFVEGQHRRVTEICRENTDLQERMGKLASSCAASYLQLGQVDEAIDSYERAAKLEAYWFDSTLSIGDILIRQGKLQEGANRYAEVINKIEDPVLKEVLKGVLFLNLYPENRARVLEAKGYFENALAIDPESEQARAWLEHVDALLDPEER